MKGREKGSGDKKKSNREGQEKEIRGEKEWKKEGKTKGSRWKEGMNSIESKREVEVGMGRKGRERMGFRCSLENEKMREMKVSHQMSQIKENKQIKTTTSFPFSFFFSSVCALSRS